MLARPSPLRDEAVVICVAADPEPVDGVAFSDANRSIGEADAHRVDRIRWMDLLEPKAWMVRIAAEEPVGIPRLLLHLIRELAKFPPEPARDA